MRYEHGTSPWKYEEDYRPKKKSKTKAKSQNKRKPANVAKKTSAKKAVSKKYMVLGVSIFFIFAFVISFRATQIEKADVNIQAQRNQIDKLKNENAELSLDLQKALSLTNIEKQAKDKLGMQKLQNNQIRYIKLDKRDYVEPVSIIRIEEKEESLFKRVINFFKGNNLDKE